MANRDPKVLAIMAAIVQQETNTRRAIWSKDNSDYDYEPMSNRDALEAAEELYQAAHQFIEGVLR